MQEENTDIPITRPIEASFDRTEVFEEKIRPLINQLQALCIEEHIPYFLAITPRRQLEGAIDDDGDPAIKTCGLVVTHNVLLGMQFSSIIPLLDVVQRCSNGRLEDSNIKAILENVHDATEKANALSAYLVENKELKPVSY